MHKQTINRKGKGKKKRIIVQCSLELGRQKRLHGEAKGKTLDLDQKRVNEPGMEGGRGQVQPP